MNEGTEVDTAELRTFAAALDDRADRVAAAADTIMSGEPDSMSFGAVALVFGGDAVDSARRTASGIDLLSKNLAVDASKIRDSATNFDETNQNNANRFRGMDHE